MTQHDPLGHPRGSRGEDHVAHVLGGAGGDGLLGSCFGHPFARGEELPPLGAGGDRGERELHGVVERAQTRSSGAQGAGVVGAEEAVGDEEGPRVGRGEDGRGFVPLQTGIEGHEPGPCRQDAERRGDPGGRVRRPDRHPVAGPHASGDEAPGHGEHRLLHVGEGHTVVPVDEGDPQTEMGRDGPDHPGDRAVRHLPGLRPVDHARCVARRESDLQGSRGPPPMPPVTRCQFLWACYVLHGCAR